MSEFRVNEEINPDSTVLRQLDGQWQRVAAFILWKLKKREPVTVTVDDINEFINAEGGAVFLTHGHTDGFTFKIVTTAEAERLAAHESGMVGNA